jgi:hypothetical protein
MQVNQVLMGGDPLLSSTIGTSIEDQLVLLERYKQNLEAAKQLKQHVNIQPQQQKLIWDEIDQEVRPMTDEQKSRLFQDEDYVDTYNSIQTMVNNEILNLVKARIENTEEGKSILSKQLKIVKKLKRKIIEDTNKEMEIFTKFKEFSRTNPDVTYEDFLKSRQ